MCGPARRRRVRGHLRDAGLPRLRAAGDLLASTLETCADVPVDGNVLVGDATELVLAGETLDLLVVGSRRWGRVGRVVIGGTSRRVARSAACPVLVAPRPAVAPPAAGVPAADRLAVG